MLNKLISFFFVLNMLISGTFGAEPIGYSSKELLVNPSFSKGFRVIGVDGAEEGRFIFDEASEPDWMICQWNSPTSLIENGKISEKYTLSDESKTVYCNPNEKSVLLSLDGTKVYHGQPAALENWPHLLLEQSPLAINDSNAAYYSCDNRIVFSCDIRLAGYELTTNADGVNAAQYLAYFYMSGKNTDEFIWFGVNLFDDRGLQDTSWSVDFAPGSHNMIYTVSTKGTYGLPLRSIYKKGISEKFTKVIIDLTPYMQNCIARANKDNTFGRQADISDFQITGMNIGFELHGNIKCSVESKNLSLKSYSVKA